MRHRDAIGLDRRERLAEKALPCKASRNFDRNAVLGGFVGHVGLADDGRHTETVGQRAAKRRIGVGFRAANPVIEMRESREHEFTPRRQIAQQEGQGDRIGAA